MPEAPVIDRNVLWDNMVTVNTNESLAQIANAQPVLLVFLRHFGCSFCREAISDISKRRKRLEAMGVRIVLVHMAAKAEIAEKFFRKYKLFPVDHISDPEKHLYRSMGLTRGTPKQLFGFMNWVRGFQAGVLEGHGFDHEDEEIGDGFQMPGVFVLHKREIRHAFIHRYSHERPNYEEIVSYCEL